MNYMYFVALLGSLYLFYIYFTYICYIYYISISEDKWIIVYLVHYYELSRENDTQRMTTFVLYLSYVYLLYLLYFNQ